MGRWLDASGVREGQGTAEAVRDALQTLSGGTVRIHVASMGVGPVTVADVEAASAKGARILAFNVRNAHAAGLPLRPVLHACYPYTSPRLPHPIRPARKRMLE